MKTKYNYSIVKKEALRLYDAMGKPNNFYLSREEFVEFYRRGYRELSKGLNTKCF